MFSYSLVWQISYLCMDAMKTRKTIELVFDFVVHMWKFFCKAKAKLKKKTIVDRVTEMSNVSSTFWAIFMTESFFSFSDKFRWLVFHRLLCRFTVLSLFFSNSRCFDVCLLLPAHKNIHSTKYHTRFTEFLVFVRFSLFASSTNTRTLVWTRHVKTAQFPCHLTQNVLYWSWVEFSFVFFSFFFLLLLCVSKNFRFWQFPLFFSIFLFSSVVSLRLCRWTDFNVEKLLNREKQYALMSHWFVFSLCFGEKNYSARFWSYFELTIRGQSN